MLLNCFCSVTSYYSKQLHNNARFALYLIAADNINIAGRVYVLPCNLEIS